MISFLLLVVCFVVDSVCEDAVPIRKSSITLFLGNCSFGEEFAVFYKISATESAWSSDIRNGQVRLSLHLMDCEVSSRVDSQCGGHCAAIWTEDELDFLLRVANSKLSPQLPLPIFWSNYSLGNQTLSYRDAVKLADDGCKEVNYPSCEDNNIMLAMIVSDDATCVGVGFTTIMHESDLLEVSSEEVLPGKAKVSATSDDNVDITLASTAETENVGTILPVSSEFEEVDDSNLQPWVRPEVDWSIPLPWELVPTQVQTGVGYGDTKRIPEEVCFRNESDTCKITIVSEVIYEMPRDLHSQFGRVDPASFMQVASEDLVKNYSILCTYPFFGTIFDVYKEVISALPLELAFRDVLDNSEWAGTAGVRVYLNGIPVYTFNRVSRRTTEHRPMSVSLWDQWGSKPGIYMMTIVPLDPYGNEGSGCTSTVFIMTVREPMPLQLNLTNGHRHVDLAAVYHMHQALQSPLDASQQHVGAPRPPGNWVHLTGPYGKIEEVWILNLKRRPDRWIATRDQFCGRLGLRCRRFAALDVKNAAVYRDVHLATDPARSIGFGILTDAEVAITYGLVEMVQQVAFHNIEAALLLEDDAVIHPNVTSEMFWNTLRQVPGDADMVYLGHCHSQFFPLPPDATAEENDMWDNVGFRLGYGYCNHALLVGWKGAVKMMDAMDHNGSRFHELCKSRILRCYFAAVLNEDREHYFGDGMVLQARKALGSDNQRPNLDN